MNRAARAARPGSVEWVHLVGTSPVPPIRDGSYNFLVWQLARRRAPRDLIIGSYFPDSFARAAGSDVPVIQVEIPEPGRAGRLAARLRHRIEGRHLFRFNTRDVLSTQASAIARKYGAKLLVWGDPRSLPQLRRELGSGTLAFAQRLYDYPPEMRFYDRCDQLVMQTPGQARLAFKDMTKLPSFLSIIPNGVELDTFSPASSREEIMAYRRQWGVPEGRFVVIFPSKVAPHKGSYYLEKWIEYCRDAVPELFFLVAGSLHASLKRWQRAEIARTLQSSGNVRWLEGVARSDMPGLYRAADICLMPAMWREGFSMAATEAMASGLPLIASAAGCYPELVRHGYNGLLCPQETLFRSALTGMQQLSRQPELARAMGRNARAYAELRLSRERLLGNFDAFLRGDFLAIDHDLSMPPDAVSVLDGKGEAVPH